MIDAADCSAASIGRRETELEEVRQKKLSCQRTEAVRAEAVRRNAPLMTYQV
jgi:hypothetical protein